MTDTLPPGVTFVSATPPCTGTTTLTCALGTIAPGGALPLMIDTTVDPATAPGTALTNSATVSRTEPDPNATNNTASATTTVAAAPSADLSIAKVDSPDPVFAGNVVTYTLTVTNAGPSDAIGVLVTDSIPDGTTFVTASAGCAASATDVMCTVGGLATGASQTLTIASRTDTQLGAGTSTSDTATVTATTTDPNPGNNTATEDTAIASSADVSITKVDAPDPVDPGAALTYTFVVTNAGPSFAPNLTVTDPLPAGVVPGPAPGGCTISSTTLTCTHPGLEPTETATITFTVDVLADAVGMITNTATVASITPDPDRANNQSTATTTVAGAADLSITKDDSPDPVAAAGRLTYALSVTNAGPVRATGVTVVDDLPPGTVFATGSAGCSPSANIVSCALGDLPVGATATITISVDLMRVPAPGGTITNTAIVGATEIDPNPSDNTAIATTTIGTSADLVIAKSAPTAVAGAAVTFTVNVANNGPDDASEIVVTDVLDPELTFVSASAGCTESSGTVTCTFPALASGASVDATITATLAPDFTGSLPNTASVDAATIDPVPDNNTTTIELPTSAGAGPRTISGHVFDDLDGNGRLDPGEPDLGGVVVQLSGAGPDGVLGTSDDVPIASVTTSSPYEFTNLLAGIYRVAIDTATVPDGMVATGDFDGGTDSVADVVLTSDQSVTGVDFGYADAPAVGSGGSGLPFTGGQFGMSFAVAAGAILAGALMSRFRRRELTRR